MNYFKAYRSARMITGKFYSQGLSAPLCEKADGDRQKAAATRGALYRVVPGKELWAIQFMQNGLGRLS
jgi:hypothetical protein